jgi:hypothetical protein
MRKDDAGRRSAEPDGLVTEEEEDEPRPPHRMPRRFDRGACCR